MSTGGLPWDGTDERLVRGRGAYVADHAPDGLLHAAFARSWTAHGVIQALDVDAARGASGVVAVLTGAELARHLTPVEVSGTGLALRRWSPIATDRVRYVGDPVAVVVADSPHAAEDAAQLVVQEIVELQVVASAQDSLAPGAPRLHEELDDNVYFSLARDAGDPEAAFRDADVVLCRTFRHGRQTPLPLEARGVLCVPSAGRLRVITSTQIPAIVRSLLAQALGRPEEEIEVAVPDVGGGFGLKLQVFGEEIVVPLVADLLGQPVRWIEDRRENLAASVHAHDQVITVAVAARLDGTVIGIDADVTVDAGAYSVYPLTASLDVATAVSRLFSTYAVEHARLRGRAVGTNKAPVGAYRGVGFPAAVFATERMLDLLATELGLDRARIREANLVRPEQMPYASATGGLLDPGDYPRALRMALDEAGVDARLAEQRQALDEGRLLGIGIAVFNELTGPGSAAYRQRGVTAVPGDDAASITVGLDGRLTVRVSSAEAGQRHREAYRIIVLEELGAPPEDVDVVEGDTDATPPGSGTFASRAATAQMTCVADASRRLAGELRATAAAVLGSSPEEVDVKGGLVVDRRTGRTLGFGELATARRDRGLGPLEVTARRDPEPAYSYGAHVCVVEVDPATLQTRVRDYVSVEDCGRMISRAGVEDQILGGIVMGIGDALLEEHVYDGNAQLLTSTMMDYLVPLATDVPERIRSVHLEIPTDRTPLGARGVAEAGTVGAVAAVGCAVADALALVGGELDALPATPQRVFDALGPALQRVAQRRGPDVVDRRER